MKTVAEKILINSLPEKVFAILDDLGVQILEPGKLKFEKLSSQ